MKFFILKNRFPAGNFKDAASTLDFNRFIRKEVLRKGSKYCLKIIFFLLCSLTDTRQEKKVRHKKELAFSASFDNDRCTESYRASIKN